MKKPTRALTIGAAALAVGTLLAGESACAQTAFTAGNLVVDQVGSGSTTLSNAGTAVFLDEFTPAGNAVQSIALGTSGNSVVQSGTATSEGFLHFSANGSSLLIPGYNVAAGTAGVASAASTTVPRAIAQFNLSGVQTGVTQLGTAFSGNNIRSAASPDGSLLYAVGGTTGVVTATSGTNGSTVVSTTNNTSDRDVNVFGGNLYFSTSSSTHGLYELTGTPTASGQTATLVAAAGSSSNPTGFSVSADGLTAYIADSGGTLTKYTRTSATGTFTQAYQATIANGVTGLAVAYGTTNTIYFVDPTTVFSDTDGGSSFGTINTLATAAANTAFRGLDVVPVPEPATVLGAVLLVGVLGWNQRRRLGGLAGFRRLARTA